MACTVRQLGLSLTFAVFGCGDDQPKSQSQSTGSQTTSPTTTADSTGAALGDPCTASLEAMVDCVEQTRYVQDITFIAQPRVPGSSHYQAVQDLCFDRFTELGFEVERVEFATGVNVVGRKLGTTQPSELVVFAAHYDSIDEPGVTGCPGADDNASGIAGVLEVARVLAKAEFARTMVFGCWDDEESHVNGAPLGGSTAFVAEAVANGDNIVGHYDYEMIGYRSLDENTQRVPDGFDAVFPEQVATLMANGSRGDFITIVADVGSDEMASLLVQQADLLGLPTMWLALEESWTTSDLFADLRRSDHAPFWDAGLPAIMITDSSEFRYNPYHCRDGVDELNLLDHDFSTQVIQMTVGSATQFLGGV